ncbi:hypothetical protein DFH09DRAFT_1280089 [Mycena vulgaris]|nr:hypothetical protein DFH09DRAFT_1280089 [Mycena vulgaris]
MLLCRRILFHLEFGTFRRFISTSTSSNPITSTTSALPASDPDVPKHRIRRRPNASDSLLQRLSALAMPPVVGEKRPDKMTGRITDLQAYKHLRTLDRPSLGALPLPSYLRLLKQASRQGHSGIISQLIEDILELSPESEHAPTILAVMSSSTLPLAPVRTILSMLQCLHRTPDKLDKLALSDIAALVHTFADAPPDPADLSVVELIFPLFLTRLQDLPQPRGQAILTYRPPEIIQASFAFLDKLLKLSQQQRTLNIFQILVNTGNIPSEAVQTIPGLEEFTSIVRSSLVRASTHWRWQPLAERLLSPLLTTSPSPSHPTISLTVDTIYGCLETPTVADLSACRSLICQIHPFFPVPDGIIRQFYNAAREIEAAKEAHELYAFTRSEEALQRHRYPCPRGPSLPWLLRSLLDANSYHAKELGMEVLERNLPIPLESRGPIVGGLATRGHATIARALWSRFAVGRDREIFVRDPALMIRMVSLFQHLIKREDDIIAKRAAKGDAADDALVQERLDDFKGFLNFVLSEFERGHSPITQANHQVLTSQARAFFIIGEFVQGFNMLKLLLARQELPDLYDVNVTLTVMAAHNPRTAAQIVQRMIEKGLQPDHITYGTVMHHALDHGDMELVDEMVKRVRELKDKQLSYKSIVSLIRGSVAYESDLTQQSKLRSVFSIIKSIGRSTVVATPHIGRYLVYAALRTGDAQMAYTFWDYLLKNNAPWHDLEQVNQRRLIISCIRKHLRGKWIKEDHARVMIAQLKSGRVGAKII